MSRLQKKCFIISAGLHLLLAVMLIVGSAFLSSSGKLDNTQILDFVSPDLIPTDGNVSGGGGPRMQPPSPQPQVQQPVQPPVAPPPVQQPVVQPQPQPKPEPVKAPTPEPPKIVKSPDAIEAPKETKHKIVVNTDLVTSNSKTAKEAKEAQLAADRAAAKRAADAQKRLAAAIGHATSSIKSGVSSGTDIKFSGGFGGSGPAYAGWLSIVNSIYQNDWDSRGAVADEPTSGVAKVTIARDGTVLSSQIIESSGNSKVDRCIQETLDRVKFTKPFPESWNQEKKELEIEFKVKVNKQMTG